MNTQTIHPEFEVKGPVCPNCYRPLEGDGLSPLPDLSIGGRRVRSYVGICNRPGCELTFDVKQFEMNGKWFIHSYQLYKTQPYGPVVMVCPLPGPEAGAGFKPARTEQQAEEPLLILGPGGDYRRVVDVTGEGLLTTLSKILGQARDTVEALMPLWRTRATKPANAETSHEHNC